ncbi:hypothetical protein [uncultured Capnocytophaga sp.]|uniref:hypothetical protein n=1 Tax=uncultured Capnocytophaga sp. TaxID=159273 RepID=UPI0028895F2F|nr:hypothetical protein [uncultured Capnocytophaga sp.]
MRNITLLLAQAWSLCLPFTELKALFTKIGAVGRAEVLALKKCGILPSYWC